MQQLVKVPTRANRTLDVFITNCPFLWKPGSSMKGLVRSDHLAIIVHPSTPEKPIRKKVSFRDTREHCKIAMDLRLEGYDWSILSSLADLDESVELLSQKLWEMYNDCFPLITVNLSSRDPPYMSPLVKHLCKIRNKNAGADSDVMRATRQEKINDLIRKNQINAVRNENKKHYRGSKGWWDMANRITGRKTQGTLVSKVINPDDINAYFQSINTDDAYVAPEPLEIPDSTHVPEVTLLSVWNLLRHQTRTASGPDEIPYWLWRDYADYLAPIITKIFNNSIKQQKVPRVWKLANVTPIPKVSPLSVCSQLRPISLTNVIMRIFERVIYKQEISTIQQSSIGPNQFALLFDLVSHQIVCNKLKSYNINPYVINWIINFLTDRKQRVVVDGVTTKFTEIGRGVPQGTVLGPVLFSIMVNDINAVNPETNLLIKYADDITLSIPIGPNLPDDSSVSEIQNIELWSSMNRMKLNLTKTWELVMRGKTQKTPPETVHMIERKSELKLLGVTFHENPCNWDSHFQNMMDRANSRLHILRICKYYGYTLEELTILFHSLIMSVFTYAIEVWACAYGSKYLSKIDKFCKRAWKYGYTKDRIVIDNVILTRDKQLWEKITHTGTHCLTDLLPSKRTYQSLRQRGHDYTLPRIRTERFKRCFINRSLFNFI